VSVYQTKQRNAPGYLYLQQHLCEDLKSRNLKFTLGPSGVPRNFVRGGEGGVQQNAVEDRGQRERGSGGGSPLVRGSGSSCNLVQEI